MTFRHIIRRLDRLSILGIAGLLVVGCAGYTPPPSPLTEIYKARDAIAESDKAGTPQRCPDDFAALEARYKETRLTYYSCQEGQAIKMAQALTDDANALRCISPPPPPLPPPPANQPPTARMEGPLEANINTELTFNGSDSFDPDGDDLTYAWDFGDGMSGPDFPVVNHQYATRGIYTVSLTVDDGRGGTDTTTQTVTIVRTLMLSGDVLFDVNRATLRPEAERVLNNVLELKLDDPTLRTEIVGHTDSTGTAAYNLGLSQRRAESVRDYLASRGVPVESLILDWKGETEPIASNDTREGRQQNRRVEITIRPLAVQ